MLDGYTLNKKRILQNYEQFVRAISSIKALLPVSSTIKTTDALDLVHIFASTLVSLKAYDKYDLPIVDGNKRSGAFAFVWFLNKANILSTTLTPEALTTLTLLIASSSPKDKDKMIGLVLLLLKK